MDRRERGNPDLPVNHLGSQVGLLATRSVGSRGWGHGDLWLEGKQPRGSVSTPAAGLRLLASS